VLALFAAASALPMQRDQSQPQDEAYGSRFFEQLREIFGKFRDSELLRVFEAAEPIQCSELLTGKGEWRTVAFFNEDRSLGDWCRNNIEEVREDLAVYRFKGACQGNRGSIEVTTEFPVSESIDAYNQGRIRLNQVDVTANEPVRVSFESRSQAYAFNLPYLFLVGRRGTTNVYSLIAPTAGSEYAPDVLSRSECKAVKSNDITFRFLICRTSTVPRARSSKDLEYRPSFGASAYFILSDGVQAESSVSLSFGEGTPVPLVPSNEPAPAPVPSPAGPAKAATVARPKLLGRWHPPEAGTKLVPAGRNEVRLRFDPPSWSGRVTAPQTVQGGRFLKGASIKPPENSDYCTWRPASADRLEDVLLRGGEGETSCSLEGTDGAGPAPASIAVDVKSRAGVRLGTLRCVFPGVESADEILFDSWLAAVGRVVTLEIRR
jgi:hypothetical protein